METFSALLAVCAGNSPVPGEFPAQMPLTRSFDAFFDLHLNIRLNKQSRGWWFKTPSRPLWRRCNYIWWTNCCGGFAIQDISTNPVWNLNLMETCSSIKFSSVAPSSHRSFKVWLGLTDLSLLCSRYIKIIKHHHHSGHSRKLGTSVSSDWFC